MRRNFLDHSLCGVPNREVPHTPTGLGREVQEWRRHPTPPCFLTKSAESHEKKRVVISNSAKKCKRVRKNIKLRGLGEKKRRAMRVLKASPPYTPHQFA